MESLLTLDIVVYEDTLERLIDLRKYMREYAVAAVLMHLLIAPPSRMSEKTIRARMGKRPHRRGTHRMAGHVPLVTLKLCMYRRHMDAWNAYVAASPLYGPARNREHDATHALDKLVCRGWIDAALPPKAPRKPRPSRARLVSKVA
jgi:hypothetical protein